MAHIVPSDIPRPAWAGRREPELVTLDRLERELPDDDTVFHSVHWTREYKERARRAGVSLADRLASALRRPKGSPGDGHDRRQPRPRAGASRKQGRVAPEHGDGQPAGNRA